MSEPLGQVAYEFEMLHGQRRGLNSAFIGRRVASRQVGERKPFTGTVVDAMHGGFIIEDAAGNRWVREGRELDWA